MKENIYDVKVRNLTSILNDLNVKMSESKNADVSGMYSGMVRATQRAIDKAIASKAKAEKKIAEKHIAIALDKLAVMEYNAKVAKAAYDEKMSEIAALQTARDNLLKSAQVTKK